MVGWRASRKKVGNIKETNIYFHLLLINNMGNIMSKQNMVH